MVKGKGFLRVSILTKFDLKKKGKPIITCCRSGNRSGIAKGILSSAGIECYNGGAWNSLNNKIS
ncbi:hypothetical protein A4R26_21855 [Niastella populi]|uniref:Rhodanese domain-containing protein n=1 Tax=Niastella populi TaxID=550983 RepID=A0A1V9FLC9_9BACT|nr:hypothetical protein A4R26_21855 [Niastella populi]